jgi:hypothetical protein
VTHPAPLRTKHELAGATVYALPAHHRRRRQNRHFFAARNVLDVLSGFDNDAREFMTKNHGRIVFEGIVVYVEVSTTNAAMTDFDLDLFVTTRWLFYFTQIDMTHARLIFD